MVTTDDEIMTIFMEHIEMKKNIAPFLIDENPFQPYDVELVDPKDVPPVHGQKRGRWKELSESNACIRVPYLDKDDNNDDGLEDEIMKTIDELEKTQKELDELKKNNTSTTTDKKPKRPRKRKQNRSNRK